MKKEASLKSLLDKINLDVSKLYHIATHDEKTSLYNHSFFKDVFSFELDKARRGKPLSLIVIDIDFFKKINDSFGHLQADKILLKLAQLLQHQVRKYDVVARFGGEEFLIMLPNTKTQRARLIAERLRKSVLSESYLKKYKITISLGVTEYKPKDNLERMSKRADAALYQAKKAGRNCVKIT
ncbi:GGDEF domain-containing protein [Candidatus Pacearchaeota archaeon]|nr:GGDEF domain-containing protein [Candidatus Pacearchaeota archaeon]